jgi:hypothetical protein
MLHHNAECRPAMSHFTYCHAESHDVDCRYDDSHYAECHFAERHGADFFITEFDLYISSLKQHR